MTIRPGTIVVATEDAVTGVITLETFSKVTIDAAPESYVLVTSFRSASELHAAMKACLGLDFDDSELTRC